MKMEEINSQNNFDLNKIDPETADTKKPVNFIREIIDNDMVSGKYNQKVHTRFPPEPNGYLHIGHAKSICLNFGIAVDYDGLCNLRFDDTNPSKEDVEYVESIEEDVHWLGFEWGDRMFYASDYFGKLYEAAVQLIKDGKAYVCDLTADELRQYRGTLTEPGKNSPYRDRNIEENLELFEKMKNGDFEDGSRTLRAKIDMSSPNLNMRDPVIYRIMNVPHHRTGDKWCIYPMYDFAHGISDAIEGITHSICTLEFEDHRPLYDWFLDELKFPHHPQQIEFARLNLSYTMMSKRKLLQLVEEKIVDGWDDPRMPTITGLRRRGYTPESIRNFCDKIGVAKRENVIDVALLEHSIREDLNQHAKRVMAVLKPVKLIIDNYPEGKTEELEAINNPEDPAMGTRKIVFSRNIFIEQDDFMENPPKKYFRLSPGNEVRLRYAYIIKCESIVKDDKGTVTEIHCTYDPETRSGAGQQQRKVKGTIHWVSADHSFSAEVRLYDRLFNTEAPGAKGKNFLDDLNPSSLEILKESRLEMSLNNAEPGSRFQFERQGYFCVDKYSSQESIIFNRTVGLKDSWTKIINKL
jgi:glutaminyl-tRNA synthetase